MTDHREHIAAAREALAPRAPVIPLHPDWSLADELELTCDALEQLLDAALLADPDRAARYRDTGEQIERHMDRLAGELAELNAAG
jgi:hypothetical protein